MKKVFWIILVIVAVLLVCGIVYNNVITESDEPVTEHIEPVTTAKPEMPESDGEIVQIPVEDVRGITPQEAEELCYEVMGEKDDETGFMFSFGTASAVERNGKQYYVIRASWLVNNSHMSYIGDFFVSADGNKVYSGVALPDEYTIEKLIWSK